MKTCCRGAGGEQSCHPPPLYFAKWLRWCACSAIVQALVVIPPPPSPPTPKPSYIPPSPPLRPLLCSFPAQIIQIPALHFKPIARRDYKRGPGKIKSQPLLAGNLLAESRLPQLLETPCNACDKTFKSKKKLTTHKKIKGKYVLASVAG